MRHNKILKAIFFVSSLILFLGLNYVEANAFESKVVAELQRLNEKSRQRGPQPYMARPAQYRKGPISKSRGQASEFVEGELIVQFKNDRYLMRTLYRGLRPRPRRIRRLHSKATVIARRRAELGKRGGKKYRNIDLVPNELIFRDAVRLMGAQGQARFKTYVVELSAGADVLDSADALQADPDVEYAEPNYIRKALIVPNDPYYLRQGSWGQSYDDLWALKNDKLYCERAWDEDISPQGEGIVVAVIDTGVDYNHPDLLANIWVNPDEVRDVNGDGIVDINDIDTNRNGVLDATELRTVRDGVDNGYNDPQHIGNGYVDDIFGYDFANNNSDPMDDSGHGTHVAGTIAAVGWNGLGIIGVAPAAEIMCVKGLDANGKGSDDILKQCVDYAAANGAHVSNNSWGGAGSSETLTKAFNDAKGTMLSIAAAGNESSDTAGYTPAGIDTVVAVAASNQNDEKCDFSNFGFKVDVSAPGGDSGTGDGSTGTYLGRNILSLRSNNNGRPTDMYGDGVGIVDNIFYRSRGTSMACPHVAGAAALLRSAYPDEGLETIRGRLIAGAENIDSINPDYKSYLGRGRINVYRSLTTAEQPAFKAALSHTTIFPGQTIRLVVSVHNFWRAAQGVMAALSTTSPYITIQGDATRNLGDIPHAGTVDNADDPFVVTASTAMSYGGRAALELRLNTVDRYTDIMYFDLEGTGFKDISDGAGVSVNETIPLFDQMVDYDNDGYADIMHSWVHGWSGSDAVLYHNSRDGTFSEAWGEGRGDLLFTPLFFDVDNDGDQDLFSLSNREQDLFLNNGDGTFAFQVRYNLGETFAGAVIDYNNDGLLDVIAGFMPIILLQNNGDNTFTDVIPSGDTGLPRWPVYDDGLLRMGQIITFDIDNDGAQDLLYTVHGEGNRSTRLWRNNGNGTFTDVTIAAGIRLPNGCGGAAAADIDNDGDIDLLLTNLWKGAANRHNILFRNNGNGTFVDITDAAGDINDLPVTGWWGSDFFDYDNDGNIDLYLSNGYGGYRNSLFRNNGNGVFTNVTKSAFGLTGSANGVSGSIGDINNDGALDIYTVGTGFIGGSGALYENLNGRQNNWIKIKLIGTRGSRDAYGAKVFVRTGGIRQLREIHTSPVQTVPVHFGLGKAARIDEIEVHWPSGYVKRLNNISSINRTLTIQEYDPPVLTPIGNKTIIVGNPLQFTVSATDPDGDPITYAVHQAGDLNHDGWVTFPDRQLLLAALNSKQGDAKYNPEADLDNDGWVVPKDWLIFAPLLGKQIPSGITLNSASGLFNWTPQDSQLGKHLLTFVASDGSLRDTETVMVTVTQPKKAVINSINLSVWPSGDYLYIYGTDFGAMDANSKVYIRNTSTNAIAYGQIYFWFDTSICAGVPNLPPGPCEVKVITGSGGSNIKTFTLMPYISYLSPAWVHKGNIITLTGRHFGSKKDKVLIEGNGSSKYAEIKSWSNGEVKCITPTLKAKWKWYSVKVKNSSGWSNEASVLYW